VETAINSALRASDVRMSGLLSVVDYWERFDALTEVTESR
jgi:hypothetical protein